MVLLDLREIGPLSKEDEHFLAGLIANACQDELKQELSFKAQQQMGWSGEALVIYELASAMGGDSSRAVGFISSAEWLCGIFASGSNLTREHLIMLMGFVNAEQTIEHSMRDTYVSGTKQWESAPSSLKALLNLLDSSLLNKQLVQVLAPTATPRIPEADVARLEELTIAELRPHLLIEWS